jgi:hypothetical protein
MSISVLSKESGNETIVAYFTEDLIGLSSRTISTKRAFQARKFNGSLQLKCPSLFSCTAGYI